MVNRNTETPAGLILDAPAATFVQPCETLGEAQAEAAKARAKAETEAQARARAAEEARQKARCPVPAAVAAEGAEECTRV